MMNLARCEDAWLRAPEPTRAQEAEAEALSELKDDVYWHTNKMRELVGRADVDEQAVKKLLEDIKELQEIVQDYIDEH